MTLKAYTAINRWGDNEGDIFFAKTNIEARKDAAGEFGDGELGGWEVKRAPFLDKYKKRSAVPRMALIDIGWHWDCYGCERRISEDEIYDNKLSPTEGDAGLFCSLSCELAAKEESHTRQLVSAFLREWFIRKLRELCPAGAEPRVTGDSWARWHCHLQFTSDGYFVKQACLPFDFPNRTYGLAQLRYDGGDLHIACPNGDQDAFNSWKNACPNPSLPNINNTRSKT